MIKTLHLVGMNKAQIEAKVSFVLQYNQGFKKWFDDRFLKYGGIAGLDSIKSLESSLYEAINELL